MTRVVELRVDVPIHISAGDEKIEAKAKLSSISKANPEVSFNPMRCSELLWPGPAKVSSIRYIIGRASLEPRKSSISLMFLWRQRILPR